MERKIGAEWKWASKQAIEWVSVWYKDNKGQNETKYINREPESNGRMKERKNEKNCMQ